MKYYKPLNAEDENASYWNADPASPDPLIRVGSFPDARGFEQVQREIVNVITEAGLIPDGEDLTQLNQALQTLGGTDQGTVAMFAMDTPPTGWLECDGSAISRAAYASLFEKIGTTFGNGDGTTTFNLPDDRGEFFRGWDHGRGVDTGRTLGSIQSDQLKSHTHHLGTAPNGSIDTSSQGGETLVAGEGNGQNDSDTTATGGTETRPRNRAYLICIKY